jgi:hypothetical protein
MMHDEFTPDPPTKPPPRPDAVKLPSTMRFPKTFTGVPRLKDRVNAVADVAEPLLECDRSKGERAYIRKLANDGPLFITRDPTDLLFFPIGHPLQGRERYRWEDQGEGISFGYLVET